MKIGVPKEMFPGERRVALAPAEVSGLRQAGFTVLVEAAAGEEAGFPDHLYQQKGGRVVPSRRDLFASAEVLVQVRALGADPDHYARDLALMRSGQVLIGQMAPRDAPGPIRDAASRGITAYALELVPRIARAQAMDVLSSMATVAGYKAVLLAAASLPKLFPLLMTAAGTVAPARILVVGAGVAGLQAIATARRLGAVVRAYDVRPNVAEEVASLGADFIRLPLDTRDRQDEQGYARALSDEMQQRQRSLLGEAVSGSDVVITAAVVPGRPAPLLITDDMVAAMSPGSVIVDLAAEQGGNCAPGRPGQTVLSHGVTILSPVNLPATVPHDASAMFSKNVVAFLRHLVRDGRAATDSEDAILRATLVAHNGKITEEA